MSSFNSLRLNLKLAQRQILTPGLVQMVSVLVLNKLELREMVTQEIMENPVLEEILEEGSAPGEESGEREEPREKPSDEDVLKAGATDDPFEDIDFGSYFNDYLDPGYRTPQSETVELPSFENFLSNPTTLIDHLHWQLMIGNQPPELQSALDSILGNLNEDGYLVATLEEIRDSLASDSPAHEMDGMQALEEALRLVQECDPAGVGARNLQECLLLQLKGFRQEGGLAWKIVAEHLPLLENKDFSEIARLLKVEPDEVTAAVGLIRKLDPFPGQQHNKSQARWIEPDVFIVKSGEDYAAVFNEEEMPQVRMNQSYRRLMEPGESSREVRNYVKERYTSAVRFLKNIEQRKHTIVKVCEAVIGRQRDFLDYGVDYLKPMMIKDVAEQVQVHASTVSRAVAGKYAHTPQGVFELRYFFSEAVNGPSGSEMPLLILKRKVKKMIELEDKSNPLTDDHLARILNQQGIQVNRRTVAKYRSDMRIPSTHRRREK